MACVSVGSGGVWDGGGYPLIREKAKERTVECERERVDDEHTEGYGELGKY